MQSISFDKIKLWRSNGGIRAPVSVSNMCPHCGALVTFSLTGHLEDSVRLTTAATAVCPNCNSSVQFWAVRAKKTPSGDDQNPIAVFMFPPANKFYAAPELTSDVPEPLQKSLVSTIDSFNSGNYVATAVGGRRTLEGIFKYLVSEGKRKETLARLIETATNEVDLAAPLRTLSHAIRDGGNLGAHFNPEKEPTEAMARQMLELLDYLITYLYVLPEKIKKLEQNLGRNV